MATLLLSLGVPMILGGDEIDRTQKGNNNAYCQDNEISWIDWSETGENRAFLTFVTRLLRFRADHPAFCPSEFFHGEHIDGSNVKDIVWLSPDGREMTDADWIVPEKRCLGVRYAVAPGAPNDAGSALLLLNAADTQVRFVLPATEPDQSWCCVIDTFHEEVQPEAPFPPSSTFLLEGRSLALFVSERTA